jgi:hypothetical protein
MDAADPLAALYALMASRMAIASGELTILPANATAGSTRSARSASVFRSLICGSLIYFDKGIRIRSYPVGDHRYASCRGYRYDSRARALESPIAVLPIRPVRTRLAANLGKRWLLQWFYAQLTLYSSGYLSEAFYEPDIIDYPAHRWCARR